MFLHKCIIYHFYLKFLFYIFYPANCSDPTALRNGLIEAYQNTLEGAEIFFKCNSGFVPAGRTRAVCGADGRWNPDPADHRCTGEIIKVYLRGLIYCKGQ